ncbi:ATP-binding cassette sub-family B member 10, mitochondrial-like [Oratosquilla oratoria]|uniref:ATP-binding cassette sub-family B member 10, mitochondrial-like n=1 Tax=Oratosquilla oratoria TaxID=337810 RepID=UPI003F76F917
MALFRACARSRLQTLHLPGLAALLGTRRSLAFIDPSVLLALRCSSSGHLHVRQWHTWNSYRCAIAGIGQWTRLHPQACCQLPIHISCMGPSRRQLQSRSMETESSSLSEGKKLPNASAMGNTPKLSEMKRLFALAKPEACTLISAIGLLAVSSTITMGIPFALGHVIDIIYTADPKLMKENLTKVSAILVGVFLTGGLANFGRVYLMNISGQRITRAMRSSVFSAIIRQETAFFDSNKTGELINRLSADTALVSQSVTMNISDGLRSLVMALAGVGMMVYMSPQLAAVGLSIVPPVALLAIYYGRYVRKITKDVQDTLAESTQVAQERIGSIRTVRSFGREFHEIRTYDENVNNVLQKTYKQSLAQAIFFGMTGLSGNIIIISVLYYGGMLVTESSITVGQLSSFLLYAAYIGVALGGLSTFYSEMNKGLGASTRLFNLIDRIPSIPITGGQTLDHVEGNIKFEGITFAYPTRPNAFIFENLSLSVPAGSIVAVVGFSGSGKSTIGSLLLRLYDPQEGNITLDGIPITQLDPHWIRSIVGSVSQEPILFSTTIRENLLYGARDPSSVTEEDLLNACREANALNFIGSFPNKFETVVGERGVMLSGGQKQRIAIARALIRNPHILLLDEATSALDAESESLVQQALERLMTGRTVITIAHRLSTIRNAHTISVLQEGRIQELGTYEELMNKSNGIFRKLVEKQTITS